MKDNTDFFQNLKLRVGYGTSGNNNIDNNMYSTTYGSGHYAINGADFITYVPGSTLGNKDLKWGENHHYQRWFGCLHLQQPLQLVGRLV